MAEATADLATLEADALNELTACADESALRAWHGKFLGDKGLLKAAFGRMKEIPPAEKKAFGQEFNRVKTSLESKFEQASAAEKERKLLSSLDANPLDVTLPGRPVGAAGLHVATKAMRDIYAIFADMGFEVFRSREVEDDRTNFELLNMPPHHPARDMWDTFHTTTPGVLLRTHTSPGQIHVMRRFAPNPVRAVL